MKERLIGLERGMCAIVINYLRKMSESKVCAVKLAINNSVEEIVDEISKKVYAATAKVVGED